MSWWLQPCCRNTLCNLLCHLVPRTRSAVGVWPRVFRAIAAAKYTLLVTYWLGNLVAGTFRVVQVGKDGHSTSARVPERPYCPEHRAGLWRARRQHPLFLSEHRNYSGCA